MCNSPVGFPVLSVVQLEPSGPTPFLLRGHREQLVTSFRSKSQGIKHKSI